MLAIKGLRRIWPILQPREQKIITGLVFARILVSLLDAYSVYVVYFIAGRAGEIISPTASSNVSFSEIDLLFWGFLILALFATRTGLAILLSFLIARRVAEVETRVANKYLTVVVQKNNRTSTRQVSEEEVTVVGLDGVKGLGLYVNSFSTLVSDSALAILVLATMSVLEPIGTAFIFMGMGLALLGLGRAINRRISKFSSQNQLELESSQAAIRDHFAVADEMRFFGQSALMANRFGESKRKSALYRAHIQWFSGLPRYVLESTLLFSFALYAAYALIISDVSFLLQSLSPLVLGGFRVAGALVPIQSAIQSVLDGYAKASSLLETLETESSSTKSDDSLPVFLPDDSTELLRVADTNLQAYSGKLKLSIHAFTVNTRGLIAIVGRSGIGKSTLLYALGTSFHSALSRNHGASLFDQVGYVPQFPKMIDGSLIENVSLEREEEADIGRAHRILQSLGLGKIIKESERRGSKLKLSGGETYRVGLARAIYRSPRLLLVDEPTSALDKESEKIISQVLAELSNECSVICVTHSQGLASIAKTTITIDSQGVATVTSRNIED